MSKQKPQERKLKETELKAKKRKNLASSRRAVGLLIVMVITIFSLGALGSYRSLPLSSSRVTPTGTPPDMPADSPSKEYIYAGGSLISTVEPFRQAPNDLAVWRPATGTWYILNGQQQMVVQQWGLGTDIPCPGDFDGDSKTDFCVYRPVTSGTSTWYIINSSDGSPQYPNFGSDEDIPTVADFDGDGKSDIAVWRPSNQTWYIEESSSSTTVSYPFGAAGDKPTPADFDGDGKSDYAIWRDSTATFSVYQSTSNSAVSYSIGQSGDEPVVGDYDGDGKADYAARRKTSSDNGWRIRYSSDGTVYTEFWGATVDLSVPGRYNDSQDSDAKTDIAVWRPSTGVWYIRRSSNGTMRAQQWGTNGDIPVPSNWQR